MATNSRERAKRNEETRDKRPTAIARYIRISPSKVKIVLDLIRGKDYEEAATILKHTNKSACEPILKVLNSAAANAENNLNMPKDGLFVAECYVTPGSIMKRMMPRAKGRGDRISKRTSHIRVTLDERAEQDGPVKKVQVKKATAATASAKAPVVKASATKKPATSTAKTPAKAPAKANASKTVAPKVETQGEKPLAAEPNTKAPLGTKKINADNKEVAKPAGAKKASLEKEGE